MYLCRGARVILGWLASGEQLGEERKERNERRGGRIGRRLGERPRELMIKIMMTTPVMRRRHRGRRSRRWWRGGGGVGGYLLLNERTPAVAVDDGRERERERGSARAGIATPHDRRFENLALDSPNPGTITVAGPAEAHKRTITLSCLSDANWQWPRVVV